MTVMRTIIAGLVFAVLVLSMGCNGRGNVLITGKILEYNRRTDSVFVSLTHNWESIMLSPDRFDMRPDGTFELEFRVGSNPPPVTFVKNRSVYAKLMLKSLWDPSPVVIDEVRNKIFDVRVEENGLFVVHAEL
jgi:hypothetical protein